MLPLPLPQKGGTLESLRKLLRGNDDDFVITVSWLLAALRGHPPFPVLALAGPPGAAKSTMVTVLRDLIDPNAAEPGGLAKGYACAGHRGAQPIRAGLGQPLGHPARDCRRHLPRLDGRRVHRARLLPR